MQLPFKTINDLKAIIHPYLFVLREGKEIKEDLLNYHLMMYRINNAEVIRSPKRKSCPAKTQSLKTTVTPDEPKRKAARKKIAKPSLISN